MRRRLDENEIRREIVDLRERAASMRRMTYYASADALDDRAWRYERRLEGLEGERAERLCSERDGAVS